MQDREPSTFESIWSGNVVARPVAGATREPVEFPEVRSRRSIGGAGAIWRSGTRRCAGHCSGGGKLWTGMGRRPELAPVRKRARSCGSCAERNALAANFRSTIERQDGRHSKDGIRVRFARHCRKHSQAIRPVAGRCTPVCEPGLPGKCGPFRRCDRDAAAPGGGAGNQAGDDSRLDGCRCQGRHRRSRRS